MTLTLATFLVALSAVSAAAQDTLTGTVTHFRDGDTIEVDGTAIRLTGVAAPELGERHGREARRFMLRLVDGKTVRCELNGERSYDRRIGVCYFNGQDIGAAIIAAGLARDCPRYSRGRYERIETDASRRLSLPGYCWRRRRNGPVPAGGFFYVCPNMVRSP